jgi:hypothetical protein
VEDPAKRKKFLERVLKKLVDLSQPFKDSIFAWEVVNEPIWNVNLLKPVDPTLGNRVIPRFVMKEFLEQACTIIEDAGFPSTVGHRFFEDCLNLPTGTIAQYHYYPHTATLSLPFGSPSIPILALVISDDPATIPDYNSALSQIRDAQFKVRPKLQERGKKVEDVFIGEFGATLDGSHGDFWPELKGADKTASEILFQRFGLLLRKGYKLGAVWPDLALTDDTIDKKLTLAKIQSLCRFTGGSFP